MFLERIRYQLKINNGNAGDDVIHLEITFVNVQIYRHYYKKIWNGINYLFIKPRIRLFFEPLTEISLKTSSTKIIISHLHMLGETNYIEIFLGI